MGILVSCNMRLLFLAVVCLQAYAMVEPGYEDYEVVIHGIDAGSHEVNFTKSMYQGTSIILKIQCKPEKPEEHVPTFNMEALMLYHPCQKPIMQDMSDPAIKIENIPCYQSVVLDKAKLDKIKGIGIKTETAAAAEPVGVGHKHKVRRAIADNSTARSGKNVQQKTITATVKSKPSLGATADSKRKPVAPAMKSDPKASVKTKRKPVAPAMKSDPKASVKTKVSNSTVAKKFGENHLPVTRRRAIYRLQLSFASNKALTLNVHIEAKWKGEYLSVLNWPLLPFYGVMSLVYLAFAIGWFTASCCNWRDLLRVQFWIGGVIAIGMLENALFYSEYQSINHNGKENGLLYFAEIVSCMKRALARVLVIIVSMGFGIVKPRLGQMLHKVIAAGTLYFVLGSIEGCIRVRDERMSKTKMYALIPLTVLDVALCWWVFSSLVQTTRTLRIRKNVIKLTLYRHFTNTLIFTVIASLAYMAWNIKQNNFEDCIDIGTVWLNESLWPFLFALILAVIMVLWRPSINNQRYAFTPLDLGDSEDDEDDMTLSDAFEGMKLRNKTDQNGVTPKSKQKAEEDLKWVEENIPSVPSTILPTIDSDEEILTTKFEISKMD